MTRLQAQIRTWTSTSKRTLFGKGFCFKLGKALSFGTPLNKELGFKLGTALSLLLLGFRLGVELDTSLRD